jgi:hypothetical protein
LQPLDRHTRGAGRPDYPIFQKQHALGATGEEILESPSICDSIDPVSDAAQKSNTGDSALRLRGRDYHIHTIAGSGWLGKNSIGDTASSDSDGTGPGEL